MRTELSLSDEWETPNVVYDMLCEVYEINCTLDVAANTQNTKCVHLLVDGLESEWSIPELAVYDVWCNPPHSKTEQFVKKADEQWKKHNLNIMMIVPANSITAHYFDNIFDNNHATYHRISGRIQFLRDGKLSEHPSRNGYFVVIWRKRI